MSGKYFLFTVDNFLDLFAICLEMCLTRPNLYLTRPNIPRFPHSFWNVPVDSNVDCLLFVDDVCHLTSKYVSNWFLNYIPLRLWDWWYAKRSNADVNLVGCQTDTYDVRATFYISLFILSWTLCLNRWCFFQLLLCIHFFHTTKYSDVNPAPCQLPIVF